MGDIGQHMAQPGLGVDTAQLGRADQRVDGGGAFAAAVGASKQVVAAADGHAAQSAFRRRVVDLDGTVLTVAQQRRPEFERVQDRRRRVGLARQRIERGAQPALEVIEQRTRAALPNLPSFVRRFSPPPLSK